MTDMQQILAGMNELNERVQNAEQRKLSDKLRQHSKNLPDRNQEGKEKGAEVPLQQEQGIGAFASKYQPQPFEGEDDKWRERARVFRKCSGRFFFVVR